MDTIPAEHKRFMDQMVKVWRKSVEEMFSDPENRGSNYHPDKISGIVSRLSIPEIALTLGDEWNPEYEDYIKEISCTQ